MLLKNIFFILIHTHPVLNITLLRKQGFQRRNVDVDDGDVITPLFYPYAWNLCFSCPPLIRRRKRFRKVDNVYGWGFFFIVLIKQLSCRRLETLLFICLSVDHCEYIHLRLVCSLTVMVPKRFFYFLENHSRIKYKIKYFYRIKKKHYKYFQKYVGNSTRLFCVESFHNWSVNTKWKFHAY